MRPALVVVALALVCPLSCNGSPKSQEVAPGKSASPRVVKTSGAPVRPEAEANRITLTIEGMVCQGCAEAAERALNEVPGVSSVDVDFQENTATVTYDPGKAGIDELIAVVESVDRGEAPPFRVAK